MDKTFLKKIFFPYSSARKVQEDMISDVHEVIEKKSCMLAHAPTGMGKTVATLAPALAAALEKKELTIFFLTSRHTQHNIAIKTLKQMKQKHKINFGAVSIIGKKWMCAMPDTANLYSKEFISFCKALREDDKCEFYTNLGSRSKPSFEARKAASSINAASPAETGKIISICKEEKVCPYEMALLSASTAKVVVTDYYYILDPFIREIFLKKIGKELKDIIIIFDEAHNLPARTRDLMTTKLSTFVLERAIKEAHKFRFEEVETYLRGMMDAVINLGSAMSEGGEKLIGEPEFTEKINQIKDYDEISAALEFAADEVRETERSSYIGSVAMFMELWQGPDKGYVRILSKSPTKYGPMITVVYRCLDPSLFTKGIITDSHSTILMSGTLTPTSMYRDLLGFPENTEEKTYASPFPNENKVVMVVPKTTTKFTKRSESQFKEIASICTEMLEEIPGHAALFFPSYGLMQKIMEPLQNSCKREIFAEERGMDKEGRHELLEKFKNRHPRQHTEGSNSCGPAT